MLGYTMVNIIFKNSPVQLGLTFKGYKRAEEVMKSIQMCVTDKAMQDVEDDFGCKAVIDLTSVCGVVLNDVDKELARGVETRIEQELIQAKRIREEQSRPASQIMMPAGKPVVANA